MVTKGDKIAFALIAVLFVLALLFRKELASLFGGEGKKDERKEKRDKKDKDDKKGWLPAGRQGQAVLYAAGT